MSKSMGLILDFGLRPSPRGLVDIANDGIVCVDGDVLHEDRLLSGATVAIKALCQQGEAGGCDQARRYMSRAASCATTICDVSILQSQQTAGGGNSVSVQGHNYK
ncbi:hypothetical protein QA640_09100 [Bradyrhizobium sp. CB82]|uniref:hypothetical protein n=1 Tax=Bradyrhizobium sp. CB82 TaxID=3039159 RepID=UPI0024B1EE4E|nr:hypothetical protein [Bradyrhizobium sp. CB82]WFU42597.1 hypothetical protein QA640_09100 [Bradyrhizobium sp. CB82]